MENLVLDQIAGQQWFTPVIECLEDDLGIVPVFKIDDHDLDPSHQSNCQSV